MPPKHAETLKKVSYTVAIRHDSILNEEALARGYNGTSEMVRDIFEAWIEENHKSNGS